MKRVGRGFIEAARRDGTSVRDDGAEIRPKGRTYAATYWSVSLIIPMKCLARFAPPISSSLSDHGPLGDPLHGTDLIGRRLSDPPLASSEVTAH